MRKTTKAMLKFNQWECLQCGSTAFTEKAPNCNDCEKMSFRTQRMVKFKSQFKFKSHPNPYKFLNLSTNDDENHTMTMMGADLQGKKKKVIEVEDYQYE